LDFFFWENIAWLSSRKIEMLETGVNNAEIGCNFEHIDQKTK